MPSCRGRTPRTAQSRPPPTPRPGLPPPRQARLDAGGALARACDRTPLDQLIEKERWDHLNNLLSDFTDKDRTFVELYYQRGMEAD